MELETRINTDEHCGNEPCDRCLRYRERNLGDIETYVRGTDRWICDDCAWYVQQGIRPPSSPSLLLVTWLSKWISLLMSLLSYQITSGTNMP
jgi:hypothetical protein